MARRAGIFRSLWLIEAAAVGWFFVQGLRYLFGALFAHVSSADIVLRLGSADASGAILPEIAQAEVIVVAVALFVPLLVFVIGRMRFAFVFAATLTAVGRAFLTLDQPFISVLGAVIAVAGGILYLAALARQMPQRFAVTLSLAFAIDTAVRAFGQTSDPTWGQDFIIIQTTLSALLFVMAVVRVALDRSQDVTLARPYAGISVWGGLALGGILFVEFALLALPNAVARWSGVDYPIIAPWIIAVTLLPLSPDVREVARRFITLFDAQWRGWLWLLVLVLLIVVGNRFTGIVAAAALILAQLLTVLSFWWVVGPVSREQRDWTGLSLVLSLLVLGLLVVGDFFTYEYAFIRDFVDGFAWASDLLRAMRGLGVAVVAIAVAFAAIPLMNTKRRIPWQKGDRRETWAVLLLVIGAALLVGWFVLPSTIITPADPQQMRVATYNIHGGYSLYFDDTLPELRQVIRQSGADVVLLQEVETGRLTSYGVDQAYWLGRQLDMNVRYFPTNESLQGLAVLSRFPVRLAEGVLLTSRGLQTGVQRVQIQPDENVLDIYNTWLGLLFAQNPDRLATQEQDQEQQLEEIIRLIGANHPGGVLGRVVFGGTFNNTPDSALYQRVLRVGFVDPFADQPLAQSATLLRGPAVARFDYLWLRNVSPLGLGVLDSAASDHRLAVVEIDLE